MPTYWITLAILIALPMVLHLRGHGIAALALSVAGLYGVGVATLMAITSLPTAAVSDLLTVITLGQSKPDGAFVEIHYVIANFNAAIAPFLTFALTAFVFWAVGKWHAPLPQRLLRPLFWVAHLSILAISLSRVLLSSFNPPRRYIQYEDAMATNLIATQTLGTIAALAVLGLIGVAIWSTLQRSRTHAL